MTVPAQLLIGVIGGSGGALLRDVLTARTPEIFRHGELNAIAALAAAGVFLAADTRLHTTPAMAIGLLVGFGLRAAAIRFNLRGPAPRHLTPGRPVALHEACTPHFSPARSARSTSRPTITA